MYWFIGIGFFLSHYIYFNILLSSVTQKAMHPEYCGKWSTEVSQWERSVLSLGFLYVYILLWVWSPLEEMKCLFKFSLSMSLCQGKARRWVPPRRSVFTLAFLYLPCYIRETKKKRSKYVLIYNYAIALQINVRVLRVKEPGYGGGYVPIQPHVLRRAANFTSTLY